MKTAPIDRYHRKYGYCLLIRREDKLGVGENDETKGDGRFFVSGF